MVVKTNSEIKQNINRPSLAPVGWALLVMTLSLTAIAISNITFGHLSGYASKILELQQKRARQQYGLPPVPIVTDPKILQIPPLLRDMPSCILHQS